MKFVYITNFLTWKRVWSVACRVLVTPVSFVMSSLFGLDSDGGSDDRKRKVEQRATYVRWAIEPVPQQAHELLIQPPAPSSWLLLFACTCLWPKRIISTEDNGPADTNTVGSADSPAAWHVCMCKPAVVIAIYTCNYCSMVVHYVYLLSRSRLYGWLYQFCCLHTHADDEQQWPCGTGATSARWSQGRSSQ
jgi:hypothetical protein